MFRKLEFLVPPLLKRIDRQLLLHRPGLWASRIHYIAFYGSILALLMGVYTLVRPISLQDVPNPDTHTFVLSLPLILGFGIWVYYLTFFRLEKHLGQNWRLNSLRDELLHMGVIAALAAIPFLYGNQLSSRIDQSISQQELVSDINIIKFGSQFFEEGVYSSVDHFYYNTQDLIYNHWGLPGELFEYEIRQQTPSSSCKKRQLIEEFLFVYHKYTGYTFPLSSREILKSYREDKTMHVSHFENSDEKLRENFRALSRAKRNGFEIQHKDTLQMYFFLCFMLWMGLQTFLKTNWKNFLGAIILAGIWGLSMGLTASLLDAGFGIYSDKPILMLILLSISTFLYQGYRQKNTKRTQQWKVISLILGSMMVPVIPLIFASLIDDIHGDAYFHLLLAGMAVAYISWNLTLRSRFVDLMAMPTDN